MKVQGFVSVSSIQLENMIHDLNMFTNEGFIISHSFTILIFLVITALLADNNEWTAIILPKIEIQDSAYF